MTFYPVSTAYKFRYEQGYEVWPTHLSRHDPLALCDEVALAAGAVPEPAVPLVALQPRDQPVVPAARALGPPTTAAAAALLLCKAHEG